MLNAIPVNSPKLKTPQVIAKADSGASHNYWRENDAHCLTNVKPTRPCDIVLPDATVIRPTNCGQIPLSSSLSSIAKDTVIIPKLKSSSLISLGQLCDDGYKIELDKKHLLVKKNNQNILKGYRNHEDGLWDMPINTSYQMPPTHPGLYKKRVNHTQQSRYPIQNRKTKRLKPLPTVQSSITNSEIDKEISNINHMSNKVNVILRKIKQKLI